MSGGKIKCRPLACAQTFPTALPPVHGPYSKRGSSIKKKKNDATGLDAGARRVHGHERARPARDARRATKQRSRVDIAGRSGRHNDVRATRAQERHDQVVVCAIRTHGGIDQVRDRGHGRRRDARDRDGTLLGGERDAIHAGLEPVHGRHGGGVRGRDEK